MGYVPIQASGDIYCLAFDGAMSGMLSANRVEASVTPATYDFYATVAQAWAQEFDTAWDDAADLDEIQAMITYDASAGFWGNAERLPVQGQASAILPTSYTQFIDAIIATITSTENNFAAQGITPPPWRGGGGSLITVAANEVVLGTGAPGYKGSDLSSTTSTSTTLLSLTHDLLVRGADSTSGTGAHNGAFSGGHASSTGDAGIGRHTGGDSTGAGNGGDAVARAGNSTGGGRPGLWHLTNADESLDAMTCDGVSGDLQLGALLTGNPVLSDPLRFGVSDTEDVSAGGTVVIPADKAINFTVVFSGAIPASNVFVLQIPDADDYTKLLDFSRVTGLDTAVSFTIRRGAAGADYVVNLDRSIPNGFLVVCGDNGSPFVNVFGLPSA